MPPSVFTVGNINFSKTVFYKPISRLFFARLSIVIANKQALLTHFGNDTFDVMRNVIPFRAHPTAPSGSPKRTRSRFSKKNLPLCWPLPSNYAVALSDDTPLPSDSGALHNALDAIGYVKSSWLMKNHILDLWLQAAHQDPYTFVPIEE